MRFVIVGFTISEALTGTSTVKSPNLEMEWRTGSVAAESAGLGEQAANQRADGV
jgi:hypothetical protein